MEATDLCWIEQEFRGISFKDIRLVKRFKHILKKFMQQVISTIDNKIRHGDRKILVIHDITYIDYKNRVKTDSLDRIFRV